MTKLKRNSNKSRNRRNKNRVRMRNVRSKIKAERYIKTLYSDLSGQEKENIISKIEEEIFETVLILPSYKCVSIFNRVLNRLKKAENDKSGFQSISTYIDRIKRRHLSSFRKKSIQEEIEQHF